ncbi:MAG: hypothetical protein IJC77_02870 [Bacteroidaceae bacterium]|nr:hypothetical protein [Bacteroidaceae bacterium]
MKASVQYNDYRGTVAADISDYALLSDYLEDKGVDVDRYEPIGVHFYSGYSEYVSVSFICIDHQSDERKAVTLKLEKNLSVVEFLDLFKRLEIILTFAKGHDYSDWELEDNPIIIECRE